MKLSELKKATSEQLNISSRAVGYRIEKIKKQYGPLPDAIVYGIVAQNAGVNVTKYIQDKEILEEIRNQCDRIVEMEASDIKPKTKTVYKTKTIVIGNDITLTDPILDNTIIADAKAMTEVYAKIYIFENSVRFFINSVLSKKIGCDWWNKNNVNNDLIKKIQDRIDKEEENPWHGKRGAHPIYYTDILDLSYLIRRHWEEHFACFFPRLEWITEKLEQINFSRNVVDHHNPLAQHDRARLSIYLKDWQDQISGMLEKLAEK